MPAPRRTRRVRPLRVIDEWQRTVIQNKRMVGKMFGTYNKLSPKIDKMCRLKEAKSLLAIVKRWGTVKQQEATAALLRNQSRFSIFLSCRCNDGDCDWSIYDEREEVAYCECYLDNALCHGAFVTVTDENGDPLE
jgi:hypothetical protein